MLQEVGFTYQVSTNAYGIRICKIQSLLFVSSGWII